MFAEVLANVLFLWPFILYPILRTFLFFYLRSTPGYSITDFKKRKGQIRESIFLHKKFQDEEYDSLKLQQEGLEKERDKIKTEEEKSIQRVKEAFDLKREKTQLEIDQARKKLTDKLDRELQDHETSLKYKDLKREIEEIPRPSTDYKNLSAINFIIKSLINEQASNLGDAIKYFDDWTYQREKELIKEAREREVHEAKKKAIEEKTLADFERRKREEIEQERILQEQEWEEEAREIERQREYELHQQKIYESQERIRLEQEASQREREELLIRQQEINQQETDEKIQKMYELLEEKQKQLEESLNSSQDKSTSDIARATQTLKELEELERHFKDFGTEEEQRRNLKKIKKQKAKILEELS